MNKRSQGLYAPLLVDLTFGFMGLGSIFILAFGPTNTPPATAIASDKSNGGFVIAACVILITLVSCIVHKWDRKGWDDYMQQIVTQSALIGMVSLLLAGVLWDFVLTPMFGMPVSPRLVLSMIPIACTAWSIGYFYLRFNGTSE